jgi:hypothetical protein
MHHTCHDW